MPSGTRRVVALASEVHGHVLQVSQCAVLHVVVDEQGGDTEQNGEEQDCVHPLSLVILLANVRLQLIIKLSLLQCILLGGEAQLLFLLQPDRGRIEVVLDLLGKRAQLIGVVQMVVFSLFQFALINWWRLGAGRA